MYHCIIPDEAVSEIQDKRKDVSLCTVALCITVTVPLMK